MTRKIHLYADAAHTYARCASRPTALGKVRRNSRSSYQFMASAIVPYTEFRTIAPEHRCAHCCDIGLQALNRRRKANGKPPLDAIPYVPAEGPAQ